MLIILIFRWQAKIFTSWSHLSRPFQTLKIYVCSSPLSSGMLLILISQAKNQWTKIYVCKVNKMQATCVVNDNLQFSYLLLTWLFLWAEIRFSLKKKFLFLGNYQLPEHMCTFSKLLSHTMYTFINSFAQGYQNISL